MASAGERIRFHQEGAIARLELNRPEDGNAVDDGMFGLLTGHLERLHAATEARVLLLAGAGADFCLGRDRRAPGGRPTAVAVREGLRRIVHLNTLLATLPLVTIAAVQGRALGLGAGLVAHCDLALAAADAKLGFPEMHHDLPPTVVLSYLGRHLPPKRLMEIIALGDALDAETAQRWGLVNRVVAPADLTGAAAEMAARIAAHSSVALRTMKTFTLRSRGLTEDDAYELGINVLANVTTSGEIGMFD